MAGSSPAMTQRVPLLGGLLQISDQIGAVARAGHAGIGHAVARHHGLRIGDELVERLWRPGYSAALDRRRITEIRKLTRLAGKNAVQAGSHIVGAGLELMTG